MTIHNRTRLSSQALDSYRRRLSEWTTPREFSERVAELVSELMSVQFFIDPKAGFVRDAWIAARFGWISPATAIRLSPARWPDFELRQNNAVVNCEVTEADLPGRRRGDEYRTQQHGWRSDPVEEWVRRAEAAPITLKAAAERKVGKGYPKSTRLIIYLNISEHGIRQREIEGAMQTSTAAARTAFEEVWVLWKEKLYLLWKGGNPERSVIALPADLAGSF